MDNKLIDKVTDELNKRLNLNLTRDDIEEEFVLLMEGKPKTNRLTEFIVQILDK